MRKLSMLILAAALAGCEGDDLGGFTLLPGISDAPGAESTLGLGFASDGALWLTYQTRDRETVRTWPARLAEGGWSWEIGKPNEGGCPFMGMHPDGPALGSYACAARYAQGAWLSQAVPTSSISSVSPDGRLYLQHGVGTRQENLYISAYSPAWDVVEQDALAVPPSIGRDSWSYNIGVFAFSPSSQPVFEYGGRGSVSSAVLKFLRWDGSAWVKAADDLSVRVDGYDTNLMRDFNVDSQGRIWLTPGQAPPSTWRWNGSAWEDLGPVAGNLTPGEEGDGNPPYTQLVAKIDSQDRLVVAWAEANSSLTSTTISMRRYGTAGWEDLGPPIVTRDHVYAPTLALASDGTPVFAWIAGHLNAFTDMVDGLKVKVVRYAGK